MQFWFISIQCLIYILWCCVMSYNIWYNILYHTIYHIVSFHSISYHISHHMIYDMIYDTIRYDTVLYCTVLCCVVLCFIVLYCIILYYIILHYIIGVKNRVSGMWRCVVERVLPVVSKERQRFLTVGTSSSSNTVSSLPRRPASLAILLWETRISLDVFN
jgi:hypothetical protein